jgi:hypothetical protein
LECALIAALAIWKNERPLLASGKVGKCLRCVECWRDWARGDRLCGLRR